METPVGHIKDGPGGESVMMEGEGTPVISGHGGRSVDGAGGV